MPGNRIEPYVEDFLVTPSRRVPRIRTSPNLWDYLGTCRARLGLDRNHYTVNPGLYAIGAPDSQSAVVVTANYKLTFDTVRFTLAGRNIWLLVADTRGINVWCAGGKGTFSAQAITDQIRQCGLERVVTHRRLILPQLGANGVRVSDIRRATGFKAEFGPVRAEDLPRFLDHGPDETMRAVTFSLRERAEVIPVELVLGWKLILCAFVVAGLLSLMGSPLAAAAILERWFLACAATVLGLVGGAVLFPLLLPWLPTRVFSVGGAGIGLILSTGLALFFPNLSWPTVLGAALWTAAMSSWLALNFTGSTPYTSPSGVEKEMRLAIPTLAGSTVAGILLFVIGNFL